MSGLQCWGTTKKKAQCQRAATHTLPDQLEPTRCAAHSNQARDYRPPEPAPKNTEKRNAEAGPLVVKPAKYRSRNAALPNSGAHRDVYNLHDDQTHLPPTPKPSSRHSYKRQPLEPLASTSKLGNVCTKPAARPHLYRFNLATGATYIPSNGQPPVDDTRSAARAKASGNNSSEGNPRQQDTTLTGTSAQPRNLASVTYRAVDVAPVSASVDSGMPPRSGIGKDSISTQQATAKAPLRSALTLPPDDRSANTFVTSGPTQRIASVKSSMPVQRVAPEVALASTERRAVSAQVPVAENTNHGEAHAPRSSGTCSRRPLESSSAQGPPAKKSRKSTREDPASSEIASTREGSAKSNLSARRKSPSITQRSVMAKSTSKYMLSPADLINTLLRSFPSVFGSRSTASTPQLDTRHFANDDAADIAYLEAMDTTTPDVEVVRDNVKEVRDVVVKHVQGTACKIGDMGVEVEGLKERVEMMERRGSGVME